MNKIVRCDISVSCVLNVCKANGYCIVSKCSLKTKKELKQFVETGFVDDQNNQHHHDAGIANYVKSIFPKPTISINQQTKTSEIVPSNNIKKDKNISVKPIKRFVAATTTQYKSWRFDTKKTECFYCKSVLVGSFLKCHPDHFKTKDHIVPKILGGKNGNNIVWACKTCNSDKDSLLLERWLIKIKKRWPSGDKKDMVIKTVTFMIEKLKL